MYRYRRERAPGHTIDEDEVAADVHDPAAEPECEHWTAGDGVPRPCETRRRIEGRDIAARSAADRVKPSADPDGSS